MKIRIDKNMWRALAAHLLSRDDVETAAIVLAEPIAAASGTILAARSWQGIPDDGYLIRKYDQIRIDPVVINRLVRPARDRGLSIMTIHSHPMANDAWFSRADDLGDARLLPSFASQVPDVPHGSMVVARSGAVAARVFTVDHLEEATLMTVGHTLEITSAARHVEMDARFARQELALGASGQSALRGLHVGVIGLGGVGSVVAAQLGHLGVGQLTLVDGDVVEESNVSRVLGVRVGDVGAAKKVAVARRYLEGVGLPVKVRTVESYLEQRADARRLADCDLVACCVDRHTPRALLNRLAYDALIPMVDMGSGFRVDGNGRIVGAAGRVVVVGPTRPCLACWGHLDPDALRREALPAEDRAALVAAGYIEGAEVAQPSVIPFNTMVAGAAVIEVLRIVTGFAGVDNPPQRLAFQFADGTVRRNSLAESGECSTCGRRKL
jgi:molybdopterin/thiamine biosynthesis adenylyltransferase